MFSGLFLFKILFVAEILIAIFMFSFKLKKRSHSIIRYIVSIVGCLLVAILYPIIENISYTWWYSSLMFLFLFATCVGAMFFVYDIPWQRIFFISITAYTIQHMSHEIYTIIDMILNLSPNSSFGGMYGGGEIVMAENLLPFLFGFITYLILYICFYVFMEKKISQFDVNVNNNSIIFLSLIILLTDILFNSFAIYVANFDETYAYIVCGYNILCCCLIFYIQIKMILSKKIENELQITSQLLHQAKEQYKESRENINLINLKCHDLRHQIRDYGSKGQLNQKTIEDLENMINIYDTNAKTGNETLDLILAEKSLYCQKKNIKLTCLADCSKLDFILDSDLYSLFGNAIDNAIEAVVKFDEKEKRQIHLIVRNIQKFISITIENYYIGEIKLGEDGLPLTTKKDNNYHGFGMKSIQYIVDKYKGSLSVSVKKDIFSLFILFVAKKHD